jgi:hypothetical protein
MLQRPGPGVNVNDRRVYGVIPRTYAEFLVCHCVDNLPICHHRGPSRGRQALMGHMARLTVTLLAASLAAAYQLPAAARLGLRVRTTGALASADGGPSPDAAANAD